MASRAVAIGPALGLSLAIAVLILGSAAMVAARADSFALAPADWQALRFTVLQASLSAGISSLLAIPVARALFRRRFPWRGVLIRLLAAPFVLPVVVAVMGLLTVFGRGGPINTGLEWLGLPEVSIFGLHGVVLANVFFNMPLATRMLLHGWQSIPAERFRLAKSLGLPPSAQFRHLEAPMLRAQLPGIFAVILLICLASFAIALMLGGGPKASTLELAIYQSLRFEFDLGRAAMLSAVQFALCAGITLLAARMTLPQNFGAGLGRSLDTLAPQDWREGVDALTIAAAALFLFAPLLAVVIKGLPGLLDLPSGLWPAALRSVSVAAVSAILASGVALILATAAARSRSRMIELAAMLPLSASSLVLGTGLFLAVRPFVTPETLALPVTVLVNATLTLPYLFRLLLPEARQLEADYGRLTATLGLPRRSELRFITLPRLARPLGYGAGLAAALSMGDLGVIALFAGDGGATLPLFVQHLIGAYRLQQAAAAALILVALSFALFWAFDRLGSRYADA
ncbi:MAG: thiamine/thiamine pyrophosphate ABC transporter permease ThiP [Cypionkella sp.]|uniref:thiamine/thiamine pyrophosphate ABC transporter permease ThiP n=1 Tax=Cypionkella sp. TaxID=2811411 RepID=UPI002ABC7411|nr:thiamine/thiamine pyrophosphate ABC transporter permease ThiP [Cypionkella sp.]MDZ4310566.1 thiamine/thiamine pyrophosphate ABC transporter permease ThiP [Cypionkella sp.]